MSESSRRDPQAVRARELVHELITAQIFEAESHPTSAGYAGTCAQITDELRSDPRLLATFLFEAAAYTHTVLSAVASGMDAYNEADAETTARFHRAMIEVWARSNAV